ncbi:MAG: YchF family ATPase [Candidatus Bostrichicola ureolyticus]|nr:MAG: YchF family ATPase [Candidatus Bostrichicola ureolyticus]
MKCGIIGLPNVGKSTIFNCISNFKVPSYNFPFCTIKPNISSVKVPDKRLNKLKLIINPKKVVHAVLEILDIAGLVKGAHKGEGLGNQFLANIRETQVIIHVLRCFKDENIIHVEGNVNPIRDKEIIDLELQLKDIETLEKYIKKYNYDNNIIDLLKLILKNLNIGKNIRNIPLSNNEFKILNNNNIQLLTSKPIIYLCNTDKSNINIDLIKKLEEENTPILILNAKSSNIDSNDVITKLINSIYFLLDVKTFFTVGKKEIRAWTIDKCCTALEASSVIHTEFKKCFIRAEIIHYDDFIKYGSYSKAKEVGKVYLEGKNYLIQDGDIIHFKHNA